MVDFKKLVPKKTGERSADPLVLFRGLDRKTSHISLREPQKEALRALHQRRGEHDHVVKMPTGTGKSAVGLLYLLSHMAETGRPVVYLCPTVQLVEQVIAEAARLGIDARTYPGGERWPDQRCVAGEAIIVCTYDKLFNAKTTFDRPELLITPAAIVLDDSHSGVEEIRNAFTLRCASPDPYNALLSVLEPLGRSYSSTTWDDIRAGRPDAVMEIPTGRGGGSSMKCAAP
ncbi:MAG: DEAD/DEAH box helicase family protein [Proteobacteria bacterium]|nr:DEAD/DEAH box helicase family protein [Pseudomonadota bacterium]